jgi:hypothetical protein
MARRSLRETSPAKTTGSRWTLWLLLLTLSVGLAGSASCGRGDEHGPDGEHAEGEEPLSRTEFTDRIENFFEYAPLRAGRASQFLIHLTDLTDGTPVERADVTLVARSKTGEEVAEITAKVGKVTGIYVAELALPSAGTYDIEFRVRNEKIDERLPLTDFEVTAR